MSTRALSEMITVRGRFHRSVQLVRDWQAQRGLDEYLLTPTARDLAEQILSGARSPEGPKAWSITGPYGTGKSAFALFLTDLLANKPARHTEARVLLRELHMRPRPFVPVLVIGQRAPLIHGFLSGLGESLKSIDSSLAQRVKRTARRKQITDSEVVAIFEEAAQSAKDEGYGGLLVIVDEFGKFLEYAAQHPDAEDLFVMQHLAEAAARSDPPILLLTILHAAFAEYLHAVDEAQRLEWQKVQGRFADVAFLEPPEQLLRLVGAAIERRAPAEFEAAYADAIKHVVRSPAMTEARQRLPLGDLLPACAPLDPLTALLLWPLFRSKLAQNERSLFAFLISREPFGFQEFLSLIQTDQPRPPFYRIDHLYDYVTATLGGALFLGERARRWAEIGYAIDRVEATAPSLARAAVKAIGLLGLYGAPVGLRASKETLNLALGDVQGASEALTYLERASIVVYRRHEDAYGLWEGSDVDLEASYTEAQHHIGSGNLAGRLKQAIDVRPVVARAHYIQKGTLRYFDVDIIDGNESDLREAIGRETKLADGQILYVLTPNQRKRRTLIELAKELTTDGVPGHELRILAFPKPIAGLENALQEVEKWVWVGENVPALQGDPVARQEISARIEHARRRLLDIAGHVLGLRGYPFEPAASDWVQNGDVHKLRSALRMQRWLSELCDRVYEQTPPLHNELLNREYLSSAAAAARRILLEAMLAREGVPQLGFTGNPAEISMYRALLEAGGFHRKRSDKKLRFGQPGEEWLPVWRAMESFLKTTHAGRRPIQELMAVLSQPPFGLRAGPLPVLLCALLLTHREQVALYENGVFVPELRIEVFERLMRVPELFEIQRYKPSKAGREAFAALGGVLQALELAEDRIDGPSLLQVVKPLVVFAARLPDYAKRTRRLEPAEAAVVRDVLLKARDPYELIFVDLPAAVGVSIEEHGAAQKFAQKLKRCLLGLQRAYPHLLDEIETQVRIAFDLEGTSEEARQQLHSRAAPLNGYIADSTLTLFVREATRFDNRDWREVLARVVKKGVPPDRWLDADVATFQVQLRQLASDFIRVEELVAERREARTAQILRIGVLDGRVEEARAVVAVNAERAPAVDALADQINAILEADADDSEEARRIRIAALAKVAARYLNGREPGE